MNGLKELKKKNTKFIEQQNETTGKGKEQIKNAKKNWKKRNIFYKIKHLFLIFSSHFVATGTKSINKLIVFSRHGN